MGVLEPEVRVLTRSYEVTIWPDDLADDTDASLWCLSVYYRGAGRWSVSRGSGDGGPSLGRDGTWSFDKPRFIEDDAEREAWYANYRFTEQDAIDLAREWAPKIRVCGKTAAEVVAEVQAGA